MKRVHDDRREKRAREGEIHPGLHPSAGALRAEPFDDDVIRVA
jgi:hypothetical protein